MTPVFDFERQCRRDFIDMMIHPCVLVGISLVRPLLDAGHDAGIHRKDHGKGKRIWMAGLIQGGGKLPQIGRAPQSDFFSFHPLR